MVRLGASGVAGAIMLAALAAEAAAPPSAASLPSLSTVVERVMPSVVNVSVTLRPSGAVDDTSPILDEQLRRFLEPKGGDGTSPSDALPPPASSAITALGSGFIIDPAGYIVTNDHLVDEASRITVIMQDHSRHQAVVIGRDASTDIALIKIATDHPLPTVHWADSDRAKVGDWVVAVGNPYGLGGTVTAGILSGRGRNLDDGPYDDFLQIDAPINRGNSGGPTFNLDGEVLGINTAIFSPSGGSIGIGFAIPASFARRIVAELMANGRAQHGWLGISLQDLTSGIAQSFGADPENPTGALVDDVTPGSPAAQAGVRQGDVVLTVNARPVRVAHDLARMIGEAPVGTRVMLMLHRGGRDFAVPALVAAAPPPALDAAAGGEGEGSSEPPPLGPIGLELQALTPDMRRKLALPTTVEGVVVADVSPSSAAQAIGLVPGDIIVSVGRRRVTTPEDATSRIEEGMTKGRLLLLINRHGASQFLGETFAAQNGLPASP